MSADLSTACAGPVAARSNVSSTVTTLHSRLERAYTLEGELGRGCFATVYKAIRRSDGLVVAVKVVDKARLDAETASLLQNELEILCVVSEHPGIVTLLESIETNEHMYFVMDYVDGGPLLDRIVSRGSFSENDARILLRTTLRTLVFLADLGCVHRDIKPENILVDNYSTTWPVKLTDFGLSAKMQPDELLYGTLGTPLFVAPEILKGQGYDFACDMWSLGVVSYLVLCGYPPFPYDNPTRLVSAIIHGEYSFPAQEWDHVSADAKSALRRMMEVDPRKRISPREALDLPWFRAAQSTTDLPNSGLKVFNARRKFKAFMLAVRTANDFMNSVKLSSNDSEGALSHEQRLEEVETIRVLIQSLGPSNKSVAALRGGVSAYMGDEQGKNKAVRRSLVLPSTLSGSGSEDEICKVERQSNVKPTARQPLLRATASGLRNAVVMQSRAKALVAEAKEIPSPGNNANPFMRSSDHTQQAMGANKHPKLCRLNLSGLGFM